MPPRPFVLLLDAIVVIGLLALCAWQWMPEINDASLHRDEARWIHRAEYVRELADPLGPYWQEATWSDGATLDERNRLRAQPPLGSYMMGIGLLVQGRDLDVNGFWNMDQDAEWNEAAGNMPERADLLAARRTTATVAALTVIAVYAVGTRLTNRIGGLAGAVSLAVHPLLALLAAFAGSDTLLVFTVAMAGIAAWRLADSLRWRWALALGIALGFGGATKLSPLVVAVPFSVLGLMCLLLAVLHLGTIGFVQRRVGQVTIGTGLKLFSVPVVATVTFVAAYPYLWRAPTDHTRALFDYRTLGMELQGAAWSHVAVDTYREAFERVVQRLGDEFTVLGEFDLLVAGFGTVLWVLIAVRQGLLSAPSLLFGVLGGQAVVTLVGMRVDWARYHLPLLLFVAVALGVAFGAAWSLGVRSARADR